MPAFFETAARACSAHSRAEAVNFSLLAGFIRSGDINTAESYAARNRSLLTESQRWPSFPTYGLIWQAIVEDGNARIEEVNVSNIVGSEHHWRPYLYSLYIQNRTRDYLLWHELSAGMLKPRRAENSTPPRRPRSTADDEVPSD